MTTDTNNRPSHYVYAVRKGARAARLSGPASARPGPTATARASRSSSTSSRSTAADIVIRTPARGARGRRCRMKLLTQKQFDTLLDNGRRQAAVKGTPDELDFHPVVKLFNPCGAATWLLTEIEPDDCSVRLGPVRPRHGFPGVRDRQPDRAAGLPRPVRARHRARPALRGRQACFRLSRGGQPARPHPGLMLDPLGAAAPGGLWALLCDHNGTPQGCFRLWIALGKNKFDARYHRTRWQPFR